LKVEKSKIESIKGRKKLNPLYNRKKRRILVYETTFCNFVYMMSLSARLAAFQKVIYKKEA